MFKLKLYTHGLSWRTILWYYTFRITPLNKYIRMKTFLKFEFRQNIFLLSLGIWSYYLDINFPQVSIYCIWALVNENLYFYNVF
jgi:hypothetical protein